LHFNRTIIEKNLISYFLEFECTNNVVEYKALIMGFKKANELKFEVLTTISDSKEFDGGWSRAYLRRQRG